MYTKQFEGRVTILSRKEKSINLKKIKFYLINIQ
jgi:hypothetical protein